MTDYKIASKLATGTYTNVFVCDDGGTLLKVVNNSKNEDRLNTEAEVIRKLKTTELADLFPDLLTTTKTILSEDLRSCDDCPDRFICFTTNKKVCSRRNSALVYRYDPNMPSLDKVMKAYPNGIDEKDMVWMFKRLLGAIWTAHNCGIVHSAILPEHILLNLETHGIWLIDWMHINNLGKKPKINKVGDDSYYPDYQIRAENSAALDIHMAAMCMTELIGKQHLTREIETVLRASTMGATDAKVVHERLDKEVKKLWGSVFRPFKI